MSTIPTVVADFETSLDQSVAEGDITATLLSNLDTNDVALANGYYGFTIDNDTDYKEFILCTLTGTAVTAVFSVSDQGVATAGFANYHRRGASVQITDHAALLKVVQTLTGVIGIDNANPLFYTATPSLGSGLQLATVQYVLDTVNGGAVSFNAEVVAGMAGESISSGDWVYLKESDGRWYKTSASALSTSVGVRVGKARGAGTAGNAISGGVFINGLETVGTYAAFTTYYLADTAGTVATSAGTNSVIVGISDGNSKLIVAQTPASYRDAFVGSLGTPSASNKYLTQKNAFSEFDQTQTTQNATISVGEANTTTRQNRIAQSFIPTTTKIRGVRLYKSANTGTFTGTVTVSLQADSAGSPAGVDLATVTMTNAFYNALIVGEIQATFSTEYDSLTIGSLYWIVITTSTSDTSNHPNLGTNSAGGYTSGSVKYNNTADGWVAVSTVDLYFRTLIGNISQIVSTDTTGNIPAPVSKPMVLAVPLTAGAAVTGTTAETTSYSTTIDASPLFSPLHGFRLRITGTGTMANASGQSITFKAKLGGIVFGQVVITATNATSPTGTFYLEAFVYTDSTGKLCAQSYSLQPTVSNITSNGSALANAALSAQFTPSSSTTLDLTITLSNSSMTATVQDVILERI